nr:integrase, catalytic region, zinc finger, CCHC-type, peptidase aspartic, catalytic [Tanacetum cinerariifolium]
MERYIRSKGDGKKVWKSIMSGPAPTPRTPILDATGAATTQTREKTDDEFTEEENARKLIDYKAASILGLEVAFRQHSCHIRNKDMVELMQGSRSTNLYSISLNNLMAASPPEKPKVLALGMFSISTK